MRALQSAGLGRAFKAIVRPGLVVAVRSGHASVDELGVLAHAMLGEEALATDVGFLLGLANVLLQATRDARAFF